MESNQEHQMPQGAEEGRERMRGKKVLRWLGFAQRVFAILFLILFSIAVVLQFPFVQNWAVQRITKVLTDQLQTRVEIGTFRLGWMSRLSLGEVFIGGLSGDTLLQASSISVRVDPNPITLIRKGLVVQELRVQDAAFNLRNAPGTGKTNLEVLLTRLSPEPQAGNTTRKPFQVILKRLYLDNVAFTKIDSERGNDMRVHLKEGMVRIDAMNLAGKQLRIREIMLKEPVLRIASYPSAPGYVVPPVESVALVDTTRWDIGVEQFDLRAGVFRLHNYFREPIEVATPGSLNYSHLDAEDIFIVIRDFKYAQEKYSGMLERMTLKEKNGFVLNTFSVQDAVVNSEQVVLNGLDLRTPTSVLGDTLKLSYREFADFTSFTDRVRMDLKFKNSKLALRDIIMFAPGLNNVALFGNNRDEVLAINGRVTGKVNSLNGQALDLALSDGSRLAGSFSSRNLAVKHEETLNLRLTQLSTSMRRLRKLLPNMSLPDNFNKLGRLNFNGSFTGFFEDFVAFGNLNTDLGRARMDMQMVLRKGKEKASYTGNLQLIDFDLGKWTGNSNFGKVSLNTQVINGKGLTAETANADVIATIQKFDFKGYTYKNARMDGALRANRFDGDFAIQDENIDFNFLGQIDFSKAIPTYDFQASINKLDFLPLHLSTSRDLSLAGEIELNFKNEKFSDIEGKAHVHNLRVTEQGQTFQVDSAVISTYLDPLGNKIFSIQSDVLEAEFSGLFEVERIPAMVLQHLTTHYPGFSKRLGIKKPEVAMRPSRFDFSLEVLNSKGLENLINPKLGSLSGIVLDGHFDNQKALLKANMEMNWFQFDRIYVEDIAFYVDTRNGKGSIDFGFNRIVLNEKQEFEPLTALMLVHGDTLNYGLNYARKNREKTPRGLDNLNIDGRLFVQDSTALVNQIIYSEIELLGEVWKINQNNSLTFKKDQFIAEEFILSLGNKAVALESKGKRGLELSLLNMDIGDVNAILGFKPIEFNGTLNAFVSVSDVFKLSDLTLAAVSDSLYMNGQDWGILRINAQMKDPNHPLHAYLSLTRDTVQLIAEGFYNLRDAGEQLMQKAGYFDLNLNIHSFPLSIAEYFIGSTISKTHGYFDADVHFNGKWPEPKTSGELYLSNGGLTVDYLKTHYTIDKAYVKINDFLFDASGTILKDRYGNTARIQGGVGHRYLHKFGFNARLITEKLLALDTKKGDNSTFYGHALGKGEVVFSGLFQRPDIYVNAQVGEGTRLVIPVSSDRSANSLSFITFVDKNKSATPLAEEPGKGTNTGESGVSFEMDLVATESALLQIIFNEQTGDVIEGNGRGAVRITVPRNGTFQMFGDVVIEKGEYLFTLYNVINKDFAIKRGGTLSWSGDPFKAIINLDAEYKDFKAPVSNFIQEFLAGATDKTRSLASQNTDVDLTLKLQGDLLKPKVSFDLAFPSLQGELQSYAENKLRLLKQDQNEMNKQVFGLIVAGQFLPADFSFQGSQIIYNTVSEMLSNQLSLLITELFSDLVGEGQALTSVDFDIAYSQYQSAALTTGGNLNRGNELQVSLRQNYFNDRLSILVGGNIGLGNNNWRTAVGATGAFIGNDVVIEYQLVEDRSLKLRIYQKLQPDIGGRILQIGSGLSYRKEYNTFGEFLRNMRLEVRKSRKPVTPPLRGPANRDSLR